MNKTLTRVLLAFSFLMMSPEVFAASRMSAAEAKQVAEERFGGKALSATLIEGRAGGSVYRVKVIKGGRVKIVTIPVNP